MSFITKYSHTRYAAHRPFTSEQMLFGIAKVLFIKSNDCLGKGKDVTELGLGYNFDVVAWCQCITALAVAKRFVLSKMGVGRRYLLVLWLHS